MLEGKLIAHPDESIQVFEVRDFLSIGFRQRRLITNTFLGIFSIAIVIAFLLPKKYEAQMKILVRHERTDSVVSPEREAPVQWRTEVTEQELQSEAELIRSRDLLGKVVVACDLQSLGGGSRRAQKCQSKKPRPMISHASHIRKETSERIARPEYWPFRRAPGW